MRFVNYGDEAAIAGLRGGADFADDVVHLRAPRADVDRRIDQPGRANDLLDEHAAELVGAPRRRASPTPRPIAGASVPFLEAQRPVVHAGGQAGTGFGQGRLAPEVAAEHAADLRHGDVAFVGEHQRVVGDIFEQVGGGSPGRRPVR